MMKPKQFLKIGVDLLMTVLLLFLMAFMLSGQEIHEWLGTGMLALFIIHHALNRSWLRRIDRGKYTPLRVIQTALVVLVSLSMLNSMVSGIMMSRYVFGFLPIHGGMAFARMLHMLSAYWGFIFLSAHLGLHWGMLMGMVRRAMSLKTGSVVRTFTLRILACGIAVYGVYAFGKHHIADYLIWRSMFVFFDYEQPPLQFLGEYLAMMGLWIFLVHYAVRLLQKRRIHTVKTPPGEQGGKP